MKNIELNRDLLRKLSIVFLIIGLLLINSYCKPKLIIYLFYSYSIILLIAMIVVACLVHFHIQISAILELAYELIDYDGKEPIDIEEMYNLLSIEQKKKLMVDAILDQFLIAGISYIIAYYMNIFHFSLGEKLCISFGTGSLLTVVFISIFMPIFKTNGERLIDLSVMDSEESKLDYIIKAIIILLKIGLYGFGMLFTLLSIYMNWII